MALLDDAAGSDVAARVVCVLAGVDLDAAAGAGVDELEGSACGVYFGDDAYVADARCSAA